MSTSESEDPFLKAFSKSDDPEISARQRHMLRTLLKAYPELVEEELVEEGIKQGLLHMYEHGYKRRLARPLTEEERRTLHERLGQLGSDRLGDVVLDLSAEALAAWLADPSAI
jgi:hypothetical protein